MSLVRAERSRAPGEAVNTEDWIAMSLLPGFGQGLARRSLSRFRDPGRVAHDVAIELLREIGVPADVCAAIREARRDLRQRASKEAKRARRHGVRAVPLDDPAYPPELAELHDAPPVLWVRGAIPRARVRIAIVGSRRATAYGRRVATGLGGGLAARGCDIVSGGARGIDTCAHVGALEAQGPTVAVLGSGLLKPYPPENATLYDRMTERGAVLSEFPLDTGPRPDHFPRRNRLIAALSIATVVVEAAEKSGSLITANLALESGREVMAIPGPVSSDLSVGCHRLIQQGAKLVQNVDDVLGELPPPWRDAVLRPDPDASATEAESGARAELSAQATADERAVWDVLDPVEPRHLDVVVTVVPFGVARLQAALFGLELLGAVERLEGGWYRRADQRG